MTGDHEREDISEWGWSAAAGCRRVDCGLRRAWDVTGKSLEVRGSGRWGGIECEGFRLGDEPKAERGSGEGITGCGQNLFVV